MASSSDIDLVDNPSPDNLAALREARDRLGNFDWDSWIGTYEEGLRRHLARLGIQPPNGAPGLVSRRSPHLDGLTCQAIKDYYYGRLKLFFKIAYGFVKALTQAGGQHLLAERAGLPSLSVARRPSGRVHYGPLRVPHHTGLDFDSFEEAQGGSHIVGAQILWWCAASEFPWDFGYGNDLGPQVCKRLPWIEMLNDEIRFADGFLVTAKESASYICDLLTSGLARDSEGSAPRVGGQPSSHVGRAQTRSATLPGSKTESPDPGNGRSARSTLDHWAIGVYDENRLHLYQKVGGRWKFRREIDFGRWRATCKRLFSAFLAGGGVLSVRGAFEVLAAPKIDPEEQDFSVMRQLGGKKIFKLIKEEISHLRRYLRDILRESTSWPISRYEKGVGYKLYLQIGYSLDGMNEANVESDTYQFEEIPS